MGRLNLDLEDLREGWDFEAKSAEGRDGRGEVPGSLWSSVAAMANTDGGFIVLGAKENHADGRLDLIGVRDIDKVVRDFWNQASDQKKINVCPFSKEDVSVETVDERQMLVIHVPRARRQDRPVFINGDMWRGVYIRVHEGDHRVSDKDRIRRMVADADYNTRDDRVVDGFGPGDLEKESVDAYRHSLRARDPTHPWIGLSDEEFLTNIGAMKRPRGRNEGGVTAAGLLMFGRFGAIREVYPSYFVDFQERASGTGAIEWIDRLTPDGTWSGNVFDFYRRVVVKLTRDLKVPFQLNKDLYRQEETQLHEALREALVNCLIHADFEGRTSVLVRKNETSFVFRNPGLLRMPVKQVFDGGLSDCRNGSLQNLFHMLGIVEEAGSGFSRILRAWKNQPWRRPVLREDIELELTELELSNESLLPQDVLRDLSQRLGSRFRETSADERLALVFAAQEGRITHERMRQLSDSHTRELTLMLGRLSTEGLLKKHGGGSRTFYTMPDSSDDLPLLRNKRLPEAGAAQLEPFTEFDSGQGATIGVGNDQSSERNEQRGLNNEQSATGSEQRHPQREDAPASGNPKLKSSWEKRAVVEAAILEYCAERFVTLQELAQALGREPITLRVHYIPRLIQLGLLDRLYPEHPRSRKQAFRKSVMRPLPPV